MRWRAIGLSVLLSLGLSLRAADRENAYPQWAQTELVPWFDRQPDLFMLSKIPAQQPVRLRYKTFLRPDAKAEVIIVHGYGERIEKFMEMAFDFHAAGFNVFLLDQRGFGRSTRIHPKGSKAIYVEHFDDYKQDLEQFLTDVVAPQRGALPNLIFAHSMGGLVSTLLLHERPDLVNAAVLSAPMLGVQTRGVPKKMALLLVQAAEFLHFGSSYAFGQGDPQPPDFARAATQSQPRWQFYADFSTRAAEWPLALGGSSFHWLGEALRATESIHNENWAAPITVPIMIFQADHDTYVENAEQDTFCLRVRDCQKFVMPDTRHEIYREQDRARDPYMLSILRFFEEQSAAGRNPATPISHIRTE